MRKIYSILGALLMGATSLFAQTNYTVTFSANVEMDGVQVKNLSSDETVMLYSPDNVITLQKVEKQGTPIASVDKSMFLQQTANNEVVVNMEKTGHLILTLYSLNGTFVARYSNNVDAGSNAFKIGAVSGVYVLVASANNQSASLKLSLTQNSQPSILKILTERPEPLLKSLNDVITFNEGDAFEFTGYYYSQISKKTAVITANMEIEFSFIEATPPTISTVQATNVTTDAATIDGYISNDNGVSVFERGICWGTTSSPTIADNKKMSGSGIGSFTVSLSSLSDGTTYYVRAYAINEVGITYGDNISFTTKTISVPTVSSANISNVSNSSVTIEGAIEDENGAAIIEQGICWATTDNPTISENKLAADIETGSFSLSLTSLANGTTYYVRTYAVNSIGISYGETVFFTTTDIPVVVTASAKDILYTTTTVDGNVLSDNGAAVTERGVCWSTTDNPTISDNKVTSGTDVGNFSVSLTGLTDATTYYACAYAKNDVGTAYGEIVSFTTKEITVPTLSTTNAINISFNSATVGGNVTDDNGATVIERGICWATTENPTILNDKITSGSGIGIFSATVSSLSEETTYYVRAYAKNSIGTAYGNQIIFTTKKNLLIGGAILSAFSISETEQVYFSQGNLQYQARTKIWRFAENQFDIIGEANVNISSSSYGGWIDLFGYGTSGYNYVAPTTYSTKFNDYPSIDISGTNYDWGVYNKISNGGDQVGIWRTLTYSEWDYLINTRVEASNKYGVATINSIAGLVLLPDDWTQPDDIAFRSGAEGYFAQNNYTLADWSKMEENGAVFLPSAGYRDPVTTFIERVGSQGKYWSSSVNNSQSDHNLFFANDYVACKSGNRYDGFSVRLVQDVR